MKQRYDLHKRLKSAKYAKVVLFSHGRLARLGNKNMIFFLFELLVCIYNSVYYHMMNNRNRADQDIYKISTVSSPLTPFRA